MKSKFGSVQKRITPFIYNNFVWVLVLIMGVGAGIVNPTFLSSQNLLGILNANAYLGAMVVGISLVLISKNLDISIESNLVFSSLLAARLMMKPAGEPKIVPGIPTAVKIFGGVGLSWPLGLALVLVVSSLIGLINGLLVVKCRLNSLMVTLAMLILLLGGTLLLSSGLSVVVPPTGAQYLGSTYMGPISVAVVFLGVVLVIMGVVLSQTVFGSHLYAVGGNPRAARAAGINDDRVTILAFVLCGFFQGLAGIFLMGRIATAGMGMSANALFPVIAAAVIGGVSMYGGRGGVVGMLGGLLLIGMITNALNIAAIPAEYVKVVIGLIILIALGIDAFRRRRELRE